MDRAAPRLRLGLAQVDSRLGDLGGNVEDHIRWIGEARAQGVDLLLFPELSLTGYRLLHLTPRSAQNVRLSPWIPKLLEAAGVDTVKELKHRKAENLAGRMAEVNASRKLVRQLPSVKQLTKWIEQAKSLPALVSH